MNDLKRGPPKREKFYLYRDNVYLDFPTKLAALKVSESVVSLVSYSGSKFIIISFLFIFLHRFLVLTWLLIFFFSF